MNLYLLERVDGYSYIYDIYTAAVVCAESEDKAKLIHPDQKVEDDVFSTDYWVSDPKDIEVTYLGIADKSVEGGVVLNAFRAG